MRLFDSVILYTYIPEVSSVSVDESNGVVDIHKNIKSFISKIRLQCREVSWDYQRGPTPFINIAKHHILSLNYLNLKNGR